MRFWLWSYPALRNRSKLNVGKMINCIILLPLKFSHFMFDGHLIFFKMYFLYHQLFDID